MDSHQAMVPLNCDHKKISEFGFQVQDETEGVEIPVKKWSFIELSIVKTAPTKRIK
jgi:hypothetical protein